MKVVVVMSIVMRIVEVSCWDVEEGSPVVRCVASICIITCQKVSILLRFPGSRVASEVNFRNPQFSSLIFVSEGLEVHLVDGLLRKKVLMAAMFPKKFFCRRKWLCAMCRRIRCVGARASWIRRRGRGSSCRDRG